MGQLGSNGGRTRCAPACWRFRDSGWCGRTRRLLAARNRVSDRPTQLESCEVRESTETVRGDRSQASGTRRPRTKTVGSTALSSRKQLAAIRDWAHSNGYDVSDRGWIKAEVVEAFEAAHW